MKSYKLKKDYKDRIRTLCDELNEEKIDNKDWTKSKKKAADKKIGNLRRNDRNECFDEEFEEIAGEKNRKYRIMIKKRFIRAVREQYRKARRKEKRIPRKRKKGVMKTNLNGYKSVM